MKNHLLLPIILWAVALNAQQVADTTFHFEFAHKAYSMGQGPVIVLDAAHQNFHTLEGRYAPFAWFLEKDGYRMVSNDEPFSAATLAKGEILVIVNAIHPDNQRNWQLPTPSAFTKPEIDAVVQWVSGGGRLFLIADHMPFPGAAADLASAFGFNFTNSFAFDNRRRNFERFFRSNGTLKSGPITNGQRRKERVDTVVTFTGQAFHLPPEATPIIELDENYTILSPRIAWQFDDNTPAMSGNGMCQLAYREFGKGKIVVSGEAAMFSAQLSNGRFRMGMNAPEAAQNRQLLLNIIHWLDE